MTASVSGDVTHPFQYLLGVSFAELETELRRLVEPINNYFVYNLNFI